MAIYTVFSRSYFGTENGVLRPETAYYGNDSHLNINNLAWSDPGLHPPGLHPPGLHYGNASKLKSPGLQNTTFAGKGFSDFLGAVTETIEGDCGT